MFSAITGIRYVYCIIVAVAILLIAPAPSSNAALHRNVLVVPVFINSPNEIEESKAALTRTFFSKAFKQSFANHVTRASRGFITVDGSVSDPIQINSVEACKAIELSYVGRDILGKEKLFGYDHAIFYVPGFKGQCIWSGIEFGTEDTVIVDTQPTVTVHEFGHILGLGHANSWLCPRSGYQFVTENCRMITYGDSFDVMGNAYNSAGALYSAYALKHIGALNSKNAYSAHSQDRVYTIANLMQGVPNPLQRYQIQIKTDDPDSSWFLDYKSYPGFGRSVTMRKANPAPSPYFKENETFILNPQNPSSCWKRPPLIQKGDLVMDSTNNILVFLKSATVSKAKVRVARFTDSESMLRVAKKIRSNCRFRKNKTPHR